MLYSVIAFVKFKISTMTSSDCKGFDWTSECLILHCTGCRGVHLGGCFDPAHAKRKKLPKYYTNDCEDHHPSMGFSLGCGLWFTMCFGTGKMSEFNRAAFIEHRNTSLKWVKFTSIRFQFLCCLVKLVETAVAHVYCITIYHLNSKTSPWRIAAL